MHTAAQLVADASGNQVQRIMFANFEPNMSLIAKRIGNDVSAYDIAVKRRAFLQVCNVQGDVVEPGLHLPLTQTYLVT
jgi:hypothetical protein